MSQWCRAWGTGEWPPTASLQNFQPPSFVPVPLVCARDSALSRAVIAALAYTRCHTRAAVQGRPEFKGGVLSAPAQRPEGHGPRFVGSFVDVLASRAPQRMALLRRMSAAELLALNVHLLPPWWIHWSLRELVVPLLPSQRPGRVVATSACLAVPSLGRRSAGTTAWRRHAGRREGAAAPGRRQLPERAREYYERAMSLQLSANQNQSVSRWSMAPNARAGRLAPLGATGGGATAGRRRTRTVAAAYSSWNSARGHAIPHRQLPAHAGVRIVNVRGRGRARGAMQVSR